jgi:hypothetical protein
MLEGIELGKVTSLFSGEKTIELSARENKEVSFHHFISIFGFNDYPNEFAVFTQTISETAGVERKLQFMDRESTSELWDKFREKQPCYGSWDCISCKKQDFISIIRMGLNSILTEIKSDNGKQEINCMLEVINALTA